MATAMIPLWQPNITTNIVDVDPFTMCIDPEDVKKSLTPNTKAIIVVNEAGFLPQLMKLESFMMD
jgi:dTDP-4-amino-4,6-dideoxygalactose transaminase